LTGTPDSSDHSGASTGRSTHPQGRAALVHEWSHGGPFESEVRLISGVVDESSQSRSGPQQQ
jgi:hypothetical protein